MERLWAGWRSAYVSGIAGGEDGCLFCTLLSGEDEESLILERTPLSFTVLNAFPYTSGHLMVAPVRHESELNGLTPEEGAALFVGLASAIPTGSTSAPTWGGRRAPASPATCTSTLCRDGAATPTS